MLKYIRGLILGLMVLIGVAYVSPTYAASANIVITQIQAGGTGAALEEIVVLYNNSPNDVNISDWCLKNKSDLTFVCFKHDVGEAVYLPAYRYATIASYPLASSLNFYEFSYTYMPLNQSNGSITGGSDTISLVDQYNVKIDSHSWSTSLVGGMVLERQLSPTSPLIYIDTDEPTNWQTSSQLSIFDNGTELREADPDLCPNIAGYQVTVPEGFEVGSGGDCRERLYALMLSEILPNASGSDTGKEFIEVYNPNDHTIDLGRYSLLIGQNLENEHTFPIGSSIGPGAYLSFTNTDLGFSLLNSSSSVVLRGDGEVLDEAPAYEDPDEDTSWAVVDGSWQYTNRPTPGLVNEMAGEPLVESDTEEKETELKPCNANQYRSPETNRCRNVQTSTRTQTPCKENQYRSEETNRCRNIASATTGPTPCKEGQERSPETNRCRTIKKVSDADYGVLGATTSSEGSNWYVWIAIGTILLLALVYSIWEWRFEIGRLFERLTKFVRSRK